MDGLYKLIAIPMYNRQLIEDIYNYTCSEFSHPGIFFLTLIYSISMSMFDNINQLSIIRILIGKTISTKKNKQ